MSNEAIHKIKSFISEAGIGMGGYLAAWQLNFINEAVHWIVSILTAVSCYVAVHYAKKFIARFDSWVGKKFKKNEHPKA